MTEGEGWGPFQIGLIAHGLVTKMEQASTHLRIPSVTVMVPVTERSLVVKMEPVSTQLIIPSVIVMVVVGAEIQKI